jgi:hypothetical protein
MTRVLQTPAIAASVRDVMGTNPPCLNTPRYIVGIVNSQSFIECKRCGMRSYNPNDIKYKYCGCCCRFHDDPLTGLKDGKA